MSMAIRDAYGIALKELGGQNSNVVVLEADVGSSSKSIDFGAAYPNRYYNVGIAELNMVSMAAGFATCGLVPFVNAFAVFMTSRALDPINSLIAYDKLNVKLCGTYCGLSDSYDGASHHSISDIALLRSLPNMTIVSVCDAIQTKKMVMAAAEYDGPIYLRLSRAAAENVYKESDRFEIGKAVTVRKGSDVTLIATGYMVQKALEAADKLGEHNICARVIDMHTIKPIDHETIIRAAKETGAIVTCEEHSVYGGLGSAVAEVLVAHCSVPMEQVGLKAYAESGDYEALLVKYELDATTIVNKAIKVVNRKERGSCSEG